MRTACVVTPRASRLLFCEKNAQLHDKVIRNETTSLQSKQSTFLFQSAREKNFTKYFHAFRFQKSWLEAD